MNFVTAISTCFQKYIVFSGRARRREYWYWILFALLLGFVIGIFGSFALPDNEAAMQKLTGFVNLLLLLPSISVTTRRLHDVGRSGWWQLISITIIGIIPLLYWYCSNSHPGENKYGPNPKENTEPVTPDVL